MKVLKILLTGLLIIFLNQLFILLLSMVFGPTSEDAPGMLTLGFALTAPAMGAITYFFAKLVKLCTMAEAYAASAIWTLFLVAFFILMGIGNSNLSIILQTPTLYLMFLSSFAGPLLYTKMLGKGRKAVS